MSGRQIAIIVAKLAFAAWVIAWLFQKTDASRVWTSVSEAHLGYVALGAALNLFTILIAGWRSHRLLRTIQVKVSLWTVTAIAQIGQFFLFFLPGPAGDDLTRMLYLSRIAKGRLGEVCATVLLDRCIGLAAVLGLAVLCIPWHWAVLSSSQAAQFFALGLIAGGAAVCAGGALFFSLSRARLERIRDWGLGFLPEGKLRRQLAHMSGLLVLNRRAVAQVIAAAVLTQVVLCFVYRLAGHSVGIDAPIGTWLGFVPILLAANAVPITIAGLGVREYLLVLYLGVVLHVPEEQALASSIIVLAMSLAVCLLGGVVYILYRPPAAVEGNAECRMQNEE
jgi:hypothetical protein